MLLNLRKRRLQVPSNLKSYSFFQFLKKSNKINYFSYLFLSLSILTSFSLFEAVKFHPSGRLLMATGGDRSLRFFQIDGEKNEKILSTIFWLYTIFYDPKPLFYPMYGHLVSDSSYFCHLCRCEIQWHVNHMRCFLRWGIRDKSRIRSSSQWEKTVLFLVRHHHRICKQSSRYCQLIKKHSCC